MDVHLLLGEPIWRKINQREVIIEHLTPGISIKDFFLELSNRYPELTEELFCHSGDIDFHFAVFLNGNQLDWSEKNFISLSNGDQIMILMPLSGG